MFMRLYWVLWLLVLPSVFAATIHGTIYDFGLNQLPNSIIEINSTPRQQMVAKDGTYSFTVPAGTYLLHAWHNKTESEFDESITAVADGDYVIDLILLPNIDRDDEFFIDADVPIEELVKKARKFESVTIASIYREAGITLPATVNDDPNLWELGDQLAAAEYQRMIAQTEEAHRVARRNIEWAIEQIKLHIGIEGTGGDGMEVVTPNAYYPNHLEDIE